MYRVAAVPVASGDKVQLQEYCRRTLLQPGRIDHSPNGHLDRSTYLNHWRRTRHIVLIMLQWMDECPLLMVCVCVQESKCRALFLLVPLTWLVLAVA